MEEKEIRAAASGQTEEIDLMEIVRRMWRNRRFVMWVTGAFFVLSILIALFSVKIYVASGTVVPQSNDKRGSSSMAGLAAMAGINLNQMTSSPQVLSPYVYPNIVSSTAFRKELMQTPLQLKGYDRPVPLIDYLTQVQYHKFSLGSAIKRYTIGLPFVILRAIRGDRGEEEPTTQADVSASDGIISLTEQEQKAIRAMKNIVAVNMNEKEGYVTVSAQMPEPYAAAQLAERAISLLQRYITEFKIEKVASNLQFVQERYDEVKREYEDIQMRRAAYKDANQNTSTSRARTELEKLDNQYNLAYNIYSELATQLEQAKINVKETTPILTVIDPVTVPIEASKPQRMMIVVGLTLLGVMIACGLVLLLSYLGHVTGNARYSRWIRE